MTQDPKAQTAALPEPPTSVEDAVMRLADMVGELAYRCWEQLGTTASSRIQVECNVIAERAHAWVTGTEPKP